MKNDFAINGKLLPLLDKNALTLTKYDLIIVSGSNISVPKFINEARSIGIDINKILFDWTTKIYGFSLEKYKKLRRSQLSIIAQGDIGAKLNRLFGLTTPSIGITASDRDFINFVRNPWQHVTGELRSNINWFNALVLMQTEDPKVLEEFDCLPYAKKVCFVPFETSLESGFQIKPYYVGGRAFNQAVNKITDGETVCFDLWSMLKNGLKNPINLLSKSNGAYIMQSPRTIVGLNGRVRFFNWNYSINTFHPWFEQFINENVSGDKTFNFFSSYGDRRFIHIAKVERKIFLNIEEVYHWPWYDGYQDHCLSDVLLSMGHEPLHAPNYLRFPVWLFTTFESRLDRNVIEKRIAELNAVRNTQKYDCVLISSHDAMNIRTPIYNQLKDVTDIKCAGNLFRNTNELQMVYGNDKLKYVHEFMFNICAENCNRFGYVTEKLFDAFIAGSIPIYYGSDNRPEPGIINPDAVLFFDPKSDNSELIKEVRRLKSDDAYYDKFIRQEKLFAKPAADYIYSTFEEFAKRLREMQ